MPLPKAFFQLSGKNANARNLLLLLLLWKTEPGTHVLLHQTFSPARRETMELWERWKRRYILSGLGTCYSARLPGGFPKQHVLVSGSFTGNASRLSYLSDCRRGLSLCVSAAPNTWP